MISVEKEDDDVERIKVCLIQSEAMNLTFFNCRRLQSAVMSEIDQ